MYILNFLNGFPNLAHAEDVISFEYRLLCSGVLYNNRIVTADWSKSDATRILLDSPVALIVSSHPFDEFPQELALRFSAPLVTENYGQSSSMFYPDDDIARDFSALLTLLCRRLVTVAAKIREGYPKRRPDEPPFYQDWPIGFVKSLKPAHWKYKPSTFVYGQDGISDITDYNPSPLGIDPVRLKHLLASISRHPLAESIVLSARLYSLALRQIEEDIDIAYQLLISSVETMANAALKDYTPTENEKIEVKRSVAKLAKQFGLSDEQANLLAIEACRGIPWASRKFTKFIADNTNDKLWEEDDLFKLPTSFSPKREDFVPTLDTIYSARGKLTHGGHPFPASSAIGVGPTAPSRAFMSIFQSSKPFPPIAWFEHVVNNAINGFIENTPPSAT
jgi:hypothetical protein